ncbi:hypothetical protein HPP92_021199 [Vanilla planifolia]|uniref:Uncharacterized protein n=1 Tax=Vanilla planifolia TaxID=51239 RepID=A0A835UGY3_VANPL|nr:hypothetical protein HPP92_021569 [Vanilla planifolia]KAG0462723.1 hypothetical protein HPP92_021199 [Vanilla planifolia]
MVVGSQLQGPKVILPGGDVRRLGAASATAAELMLDHPGYFLVHSSAMLINRRLFALSADEELELGAIYAMFPMDRLGSPATTADIGRLLLLSSGKEGCGEAIRPNPAVPAPETGSKLEEVDDHILIADFRYKKSLCRSRRPALETITEEAMCQ